MLTEQRERDSQMADRKSGVATTYMDNYTLRFMVPAGKF